MRFVALNLQPSIRMQKIFTFLNLFYIYKYIKIILKLFKRRDYVRKGLKTKGNFFFTPAAISTVIYTTGCRL